MQCGAAPPSCQPGWAELGCEWGRGCGVVWLRRPRSRRTFCGPPPSWRRQPGPRRRRHQAPAEPGTPCVPCWFVCKHANAAMHLRRWPSEDDWRLRSVQHRQPRRTAAAHSQNRQPRSAAAIPLVQRQGRARQPGRDSLHPLLHAHGHVGVRWRRQFGAPSPTFLRPGCQSPSRQPGGGRSVFRAPQCMRIQQVCSSPLFLVLARSAVLFDR